MPCRLGGGGGIECLVQVVLPEVWQNSLKNPKKIVKPACNFPKVVYSIGVAERERVAPPAENR